VELASARSAAATDEGAAGERERCSSPLFLHSLPPCMCIAFVFGHLREPRLCGPFSVPRAGCGAGTSAVGLARTGGATSTDEGAAGGMGKPVSSPYAHFLSKP
jgi:hypothetical protein